MGKSQEGNLIQFDNVAKSYSDKKVLNQLSFSVQENEFVALVGNNGCGKTTTINIACNLVPYDNGEVRIFGSKVTPDYTSYKSRLGVVLSSPYSIEEFSVLDYLSFVGEFQFVAKNEISVRAKDIIRLFELDEYESRAIKNLSSGSKMKVSLAAALIHNPQVLVLDEPFVNLDINTVQNLIGILKSFRGKKTLFITSHSLDLVVELCDRFLIMENGAILAEVRNNEALSSNELKEKIKGYLVSMSYTGKQIDWLK